VKQIRKRLTYANVMSSIAVFLVVGGATAFAALGKNTVGTKQIKKNAVTTQKIKNNAVSGPKLQANSATTDKIADGAVTGSKLAGGSVSTDKITDGAVTGGKLGNGSVTAEKLGGGSVTNEKLGNGSVTNEKLGNGSVTNEKLGNGSVTSEKLAPGAVTTTNIVGAALIPRGYAFVDTSGKVNPNFTVNIPDGTHPSAGIFCFTLGFAPKHAQVTVEGDTEPNDLGSVVIAGAGETLNNCPGGTNVEVQTWDTQTDELSTESFFLVVW
jgi:hypothetical protein